MVLEMEEEMFPQVEVGCGLVPDLIQSFWVLGMSNPDSVIVRSSAACIFAYFFNELSEISVFSLDR